MSTQELTSLIENFRQQIIEYNALFALAQRKQPALIKGELQEIEKITKEERTIVIKVGKLEEGRLFLQHSLASHFGLLPQELTVSVLIERLEEADAAQLKQYSDELMDVLKQLKSLNDANKQLIEQSLEYIDYTVNLLTSFDESPSYSNQETDVGDRRAKLFDHKA